MLRRRLWLIHHVKVLLTLLLKTISRQKIPRHSGIAGDLQWLSTINLFSNSRVDVVKEVVLPEVPKLNDLVMNKNHRDKKQFSPEKKNSRKRKMGLLLSVYYHTFKVNNRNTRTRCEIWSKLTIKTSFWCLYC